MHAPSSTPWWQENIFNKAHDAAPQPALPTDMPDHIDVLIVGAGLTGIEAARVLAGHGRTVLVADAGLAGGGASTRNAGMVGCNFKHRYTDLRARLGADAARAIFAELRGAFNAVADLAASTDTGKSTEKSTGESMGWRPRGRVIGAMTQEALARLNAEYRLRADELGENVSFLDRRAMEDEIALPLYLGGVRLNDNAAVHPGHYTALMIARARAAGAKVYSHCPVQRIVRTRAGFIATLGDAPHEHRVQCGDVAIATNGYTGAALTWFTRRLVPITSYMLATHPLTGDMLNRLWPHARTYHCTRRRSHFMTITADARLVFGGRTGEPAARFDANIETLRADLSFMFPALRDIGPGVISHAWTGRCAATRDMFPRVGVNPDGMHYAIGYCFSGNAMAPWLARKMAAAILGRADEAASVFRAPHFPAVPWPGRAAWAMPLAMRWAARADRPAGLARRL